MKPRPIRCPWCRHRTHMDGNICGADGCECVTLPSDWGDWDGIPPREGAEAR